MPGTDIQLLADAALESGRIARSFWREDPQVWDKGGDDPVSEADFAVDAYLKETLLMARPEYGWVSEETDDDPARMSKSRVFVVDPIDGTRSFVAGEKTWAHSLAIVEGGTPVAACVYLPVRDKLYLATRGGGATLNGTPLRASCEIVTSPMPTETRPVRNAPVPVSAALRNRERRTRRRPKLPFAQ